jgi:hypothetical protein
VRWLALGGAIAAIALAGCGDDDGDEGEVDATSPPAPAVVPPAESPPPSAQAPEAPPEAGISYAGAKQAVRVAIQAVLVSGDPRAACRAFVTERYLKEAFGNREGCVRSILPGSAARSVRVSRIHLAGGRASARAVPAGGPSDGEKIRVKLVQKGDRWKVDKLRSRAPVGP